MELLIDFGVPVITALFAYLAATKKHSIKLKETKLILEKEIESIEKSHEIKVKELEKEMEVQNKSKENDVMLDIMGQFMGSALEDPKKLDNLLRLAQMASAFNGEDTK